MGLQFLREDKSDFFGISFIVAPLKLAVSSPLIRHELAYLSKGERRKGQHFLIRLLEKPSAPGADLKLAFLRELSRSSKVRGDSRDSLSAGVSLELVTSLEEAISSPRKFSMTLV